jgi:epoxyqueuosine reductase
MVFDSELKEKVTSWAVEEGFDLCGVSPADPDSLPELAYFPEWVSQGQAGEMKYLEARNEAGELKRAALQNFAPWARSVIVCAINYNSAQPNSTENLDTSTGWVSRYAWFKNELDGKPVDYHDAVLRRLRQLESRLAEYAASQNHALQTRCYVDTGPVVERVYAKYAGLGWIGKNTCVINQQIGSWIFLGVIVTSVPTPADVPLIPAADRCGSCTRCIEACPTGALTEPYKMDARRCIAYLTIEKRGVIADEFKEAIGRNVFGCDICQDVCPWNGAENPARERPASRAPEFQPRPELVAPQLAWLGAMSREEFNRKLRGSPLKRAKYEGFLRNVAIAMGNSADPGFRKLLMEMAQYDSPAVQDAARWAMQKLPPEQ